MIIKLTEGVALRPTPFTTLLVDTSTLDIVRLTEQAGHVLQRLLVAQPSRQQEILENDPAIVELVCELARQGLVRTDVSANTVDDIRK